MNIYITGTSDITNSLISEVCEELNKPKGVIYFKTNETLTQSELSKIDSGFKKLKTIDSLTFIELFKICEGYRNLYRINEEDFVVVLTSIRNQPNWFSATQNRNIFIDVNDWNQFTGKNPKYGISYQVVENIFQSLIGIDYKNANNHPNIHFDNIGCINDFCKEKKNVIIKLRTADICLSCQEKSNDIGIDNNIMNHIQEIMESIRKNVRMLNTYENVKLEKVTIDSKGNIKIGRKKIEMKELPSTLFIFFLNKHVPISKTSLKKHFSKILDIYEKVDGRGNTDTIEKLIDPNGKGFRQNKWRVNYAIGNSISESLLGYYIIDEVEGNKYFISLSQEYKEIHNNLTL
jgi:hypothetical protein